MSFFSQLVGRKNSRSPGFKDSSVCFNALNRNSERIPPIHLRPVTRTGNKLKTLWRFQFGNRQFWASSRKSRDCAEAYAMYAAQEIPQIDAEIAQKGHSRWKLIILRKILQAYQSVRHLCLIWHPCFPLFWEEHCK